MNNENFKDDIERAERNILIFAWVGAIASVSIIACVILGV